jgi:hypothetical protein
VVKLRDSLKVRVRTSSRIKFLARGEVWVKASCGPGIRVDLGLMLFFGLGLVLVLSFVMVSISDKVRI